MGPSNLWSAPSVMAWRYARHCRARPYRRRRAAAYLCLEHVPVEAAPRGVAGTRLHARDEAAENAWRRLSSAPPRAEHLPSRSRSPLPRVRQSRRRSAHAPRTHANAAVDVMTDRAHARLAVQRSAAPPKQVPSPSTSSTTAATTSGRRRGASAEVAGGRAQFRRRASRSRCSSPAIALCRTLVPRRSLASQADRSPPRWAERMGSARVGGRRAARPSDSTRGARVRPRLSATFIGSARGAQQLARALELVVHRRVQHLRQRRVADDLYWWSRRTRRARASRGRRRRPAARRSAAAGSFRRARGVSAESDAGGALEQRGAAPPWASCWPHAAKSDARGARRWESASSEAAAGGEECRS